MIKKLQKRIKKYLDSPQHVRTVTLVVLLGIAIAIPLTVYVVQSQHDIRQHAVDGQPYYGGTQTVGCGEIVGDLAAGTKEGILTYRTPASINNQWVTKKLDGSTLSQEDIRNKMRSSHFYQDIGSGNMEQEITRLVPNPSPSSTDYHPEVITCRLYFDYNLHDCRVSFVDPSEAGKSNTNWLYVADQPKDIQLRIAENTGGTSNGQCDLEIHIHTPPAGGTTPTVTGTITPTVTGTVTPTITGTPTVTPTGSITPTVTPTLTPTKIPTPTVTPTPTMPSTPTLLSVSVSLPGIGKNGNATPNNMQRDASLQLGSLPSVNGKLSFQGGVFKGLFNLGTVVPTGSYTIKLKTNQFLGKTIASGSAVTAGVTNTLPEVKLISGDINSDNKLDMLDYNILIGCFGSKINSETCGLKKVDADLNDDGLVDGVDYNLFLSGIKVGKQGD